MQKRSQHNNDKRTHFFRKIYLSHFIRMVAKGLRKGYVWEVSWRLNKLQHIDPLAAFLSRSAGLFNQGSWVLSPLLELVLTIAFYLQLTEFPVAPGYIIVWLSPASCERHIYTQFNPSTVKAISWCLRPETPVSRLTAGSQVSMLQMNVCQIIFMAEGLNQ